MIHGRTNDVHIDSDARRVVKNYPSRPTVLWNAAEREAAALHVLESAGLSAPRLLGRGVAHLQMTLVDGTPLPELGRSAATAWHREAALYLWRVHQVEPVGVACVCGEVAPAGCAHWPQCIRDTTFRLLSWLSQDAALPRQVVSATSLRVEDWCGRIRIGRIALVHGDFCGANVLVEPISAVDWEWSCAGDASYDIGRLYLAAHMHQDPNAVGLISHYGRISSHSGAFIDSDSIAVYSALVALGLLVSNPRRRPQILSFLESLDRRRHA